MVKGPGASLAVGFVLDDGPTLHWQAEVIRQALSVPGVEPVLLLIPKAESEVTSPPFFSRLRTALYRGYRRHFLPPAMAAEDIGPLLGQIPVMPFTTIPEELRSSFRPQDLETIASHRLDVLLHFGSTILTGPILTLPRYGVWSFHHGDPARFRGGPPGLWEILHGEPVTGAILQRLTEVSDGGMVLRQGWFATVDHSHAETVETVLMHSAVWPAQIMHALLSGDTQAAEGMPPATLGKLYRYPGNIAFLRFLWRMVANKLRSHRRDLTAHEEWNIGVLNSPIHTLLGDLPPMNVRWLPPPANGSFRADPFGYRDAEGRLNVLYEKFDHSTGRGVIARLRPKQDNVIKRSRTMLQSEGRLSYPYVVVRNDEVFVLPGCAELGRVDLYRVNETNEALEHSCVLLEEALVDPTLFQHDGRWWLFGTKAPLTNVSLHAYWSDRLEGPYTAHLLNPVKLDIRSARPGGTPFMHGGSLWRPARDSSLINGGRIAFNRITDLGPDRFAEETVHHLGPLKGSAYGAGLHTLCSVGDVTLLDGKRFAHVPEPARSARERKRNRLKRDSA